MKRVQQGFTLIELMIVVAIIGILAAVALPAYQDYTIRSQMTEPINLADGAKAAVADYWSNTGDYPADSAAAGFAGASGKYTTGVEIEGNVITATVGGEANSAISGATVTLTAEATTEGNLKWSCASSADSKYLPVACRGS
jgi:type IV pilus assembly protein PilA